MTRLQYASADSWHDGHLFSLLSSVQELHAHGASDTLHRTGSGATVEWSSGAHHVWLQMVTTLPSLSVKNRLLLVLSRSRRHMASGPDPSSVIQ
jgi:hypothetical protein